MNKFKLNWQSLVVGMLLCAVLGVFVGSKIADPQVVQRADAQRFANTGDIYEKTVAVETKLAAMDERLIRMSEKLATVNERMTSLEQKVDTLNNDMEVVLRVLKRLDPQKNK